MIIHMRGGVAPSGARRRKGGRGAVRLEASPGLSVRLSTFLKAPDRSLLRRIFWPVLLVAVLFFGKWLYEGILPYANQPITEVSVPDELHYVTEDAVKQRIAGLAARNFFDVDLVGMRQALEDMTWIAEAEIRRIWPDQLVIHLSEQLPVARWGDQSLLNSAGQAFGSEELRNYGHLPELFGPDGSEREVMDQYQELSQILRGIGFSIRRLELHARGSWFLTTENGVRILLGHGDLMNKIARLERVYSAVLSDRIDQVSRIDLRHAHGVAVAWKDAAVVAGASEK